MKQCSLCNTLMTRGEAMRSCVYELPWHSGTMAQRHQDLIVSLAECMVGPIHFEILTVFSDERHRVITAQRQLNVSRSSHATRRDAHSVQGPALQSLFCRGQGTEAQWHNGTLMTIALQMKLDELPSESCDECGLLPLLPFLASTD